MSNRIVVRQSPIHGRGVFARVDIPRQTEIMYYEGRLISHDEADACYGDDAEGGHTFLFTLNDTYIVDGNVGGNSARWINHSCAPNCEAVIEEAANGRPECDKVLIRALQDIPAGSELTYNYGIVLEVEHTPRLQKIWACHCGASTCRHTLLQPKTA